MPRAEPNRKRCAIYTRKSSEEGLEQEFNSLAAQREACEAYICSHVNARYRCQFLSNLEVSVARGFGSGVGRARSPQRSAASDRRPMHCARNRNGSLTERASARSARGTAQPTLNRRASR